MSKEKSIEATEIFSILSNTINGANFDDLCDATHMIVHNAGYHKQSEGEWIEYSEIGTMNNHLNCSVCNWETVFVVMGKREYKFCPNCGAKMKGGAE